MLSWYQLHGRHDLPWQQPITPYRVWISEIMLQQTQVATVIPYFQAFMQRFPDIEQLASANLDEVLAHWSGLGYYARARNLHKAARQIINHHQGKLPMEVDSLLSLAGIGRSTAHAILSIAHQQPLAICDGNVKRVLARWSALEVTIDSTQGQQKLWSLAQQLQSHQQPGNYTQAIMDLGATLCTRTKPNCSQCPIQDDCQAYQSGLAVTQWPKRKAKKDKPIKKVHFYLPTRDDGRIWLQAPSAETGIWGGLYQPATHLPPSLLPEANIDLPEIRHQFTHFSLQISCSVIAIKEQDTSLFSKGIWYNPKELITIARPAVVDKLIHLWQQMQTKEGVHES